MLNTNECIPLFEPADRVTGHCTDNVKGCRFVTPVSNPLSGPGIPPTPQIGASDATDGANFLVEHTPAGLRALGVSAADALMGEKVGVISEGIVPVLAGANLLPGEDVGAGAEGKAVALAASGAGAATLKTGVEAENNAIEWIQLTPGAAKVKVVLKVSGANTPLTVEAAGEVITVNVATSAGSAAISTAAEVIEAVNNTAASNAKVEATNYASSNGSGVVAAVAETALAGGTGGNVSCGLVCIGAASGSLAYIKLHC